MFVGCTDTADVCRIQFIIHCCAFLYGNTTLSYYASEMLPFCIDKFRLIFPGVVTKIELKLISEPVPCVALIVNGVSLCSLSPRAVNTNASNWCLQLVFKVRPGLFSPPVPWLAKSSSVQVGKEESGTDRSPLAVGAALGWVKPVPAQAWLQLHLGASLVCVLWWRWLGEVLGTLKHTLFCCPDQYKLFLRNSFPCTMRSGAP